MVDTAHKAMRTTRGFAAASFQFVVTTDDDRTFDAVETLFSDLDPGNDPTAEFTITGGVGRARLEGPEPLTPAGLDGSDTVLTDLVTAVNRQMLDAGADRLHLHAGLVARNGSAVVISAPSGHGKTTLTTALALRGWVYLTDEAVSIAAGDPLARSFPKPISVKSSGSGLFPELADHIVSGGGVGEALWHVPLGRLGVPTATAAEPSLVVILSRVREREVPSWEPVTPADAMVQLIEQSLDLERYGQDALVALAELCARCRCVHIEAGTPAATSELVEQLTARDNRLDLAVRRFEIASGGPTDVESIGIGDEAVLRHPRTGIAVSLNAAAARIWEELCAAGAGHQPSPKQADFVRQLTEMDFVRPSSGDAGDGA